MISAFSAWSPIIFLTQSYSGKIVVTTVSFSPLPESSDLPQAVSIAAQSAAAVSIDTSFLILIYISCNYEQSLQMP